jgi:hypothetical protein
MRRRLLASVAVTLSLIGTTIVVPAADAAPWDRSNVPFFAVDHPVSTTA